jgi:hypothetical protein
MRRTHFRWNGETLLSYGTIQCVRVRSVLHIVSLGELSYLLTAILPTSQCFHGWAKSTFCKIAPFRTWNKHCISSRKRINVRSKRVKKRSPVSIQLTFERDTAFLKGFSCVKNMTFEQNCSFVSMEEALYFFFLFIYFLFYSYVHTMFGSFLPTSPTASITPPAPSLFPATPSLPSRNYFALISNFVEERV